MFEEFLGAVAYVLNKQNIPVKPHMIIGLYYDGERFEINIDCYPTSAEKILFDAANMAYKYRNGNLTAKIYLDGV